jgi:hypothetical protein
MCWNGLRGRIKFEGRNSPPWMAPVAAKGVEAMRSGIRAGAIMALLCAAGLLPAARTHAQGAGQDTSRAERRSTATEYQAQRRQLLEQLRAGALDAPPAYGSARVGAGSNPRINQVVSGAAAGDPDGVPVRCDGVLAQGPLRRPAPSIPDHAGYVFRGECVPLPFGPPVGGRGFGLTPFDGILEYGYGSPYGWGGYGRGGYPLQSWGWSPAPGAAYGFAPWPGVAGSDCARVQILSASGAVHEILVALRPMGIARAVDLDLAIDERLSRGRPVDLIGIDGRRLRLEPGALLDDVRVLPCEPD